MREALRGHQRHSEVISGGRALKGREYSRCACLMREAIRGHQRSSGREYSRCACLSASRRFASSDFSSATMASSFCESATCHLGRPEVIG